MKHLTSVQISKLAAGFFNEFSEEERHCRECPGCAAELERFRGVVSLFRSSVRDWIEKQNQAEFPVVHHAARRSEPIHWQSLTWVLVGTGLALAIAVPVYRDSRDRQIKAQAAEDVLLTEDVNEHLARRVPVAMNSLMQLMPVENSGAAADSTKPDDRKKPSSKTSNESPGTSPRANGGVQ
ncbi:MAG TPA: hypothetical protein VK210_03810 [Terriglobia bacterium]|nr:hypothetical protein [Terriglobia bacterium]